MKSRSGLLLRNDAQGGANLRIKLDPEFGKSRPTTKRFGNGIQVDEHRDVPVPLVQILLKVTRLAEKKGAQRIVM